MTDQEFEQLKHDLKVIIIRESDNEDEFDIDDIDDNAPLIGSDSDIGLDSLDVLQIVMAIQVEYDVRIESGKEGRLAFASVNALANVVRSG